MAQSPADDAPRRVLILDFDGVVVNTEEVHFESWREAFRQQLGVRLPGDYTQVVGLTLDELFEMWRPLAPVPLTADLRQRLLAAKTDLFFTVGKGRFKPIPGVADLVRDAQRQGWYAAIASRGRRMRLLRTLELARVPAVFELILALEDAVDPTTDRKVHARAAWALGAEPAACVVVEDSLSGIADALDSGIGRVIGLTTSFDAAALRQAGAHEVISRLDEVRLPSIAVPSGSNGGGA
jgi:sugar-phosphatase